ncbi:tyrosine-type recombinase/integrase [Streptomyces sp. NPDC097727]|uniref:tyrosine-type recombinase/integrase n=1 Tax=Streptomyces sp. NPDC097727 TaxID=3366092 RepID=UPI0038293722
MANIVARRNRAGEVSSYQVRWREGGLRTGEQQTERFDDEDSAKAFRDAVDEAGQNWPLGWVKGKGYIAPTAADELRYRFDRWSVESVENRTASKRYKQQRIRALEMYMFPTFGNCDIRSAEHFSKATIGAWVNKMLKMKVKRGSKTKDMSPETLRGLHGLLSSVLKEAVVAEPPLRDRNPCDLTRLPSNDDWGISDDESSDDMEFMTPEEVAGLVECFPRPSDRMLVRTAYGSGLRWGEISALAARHARNPRPGEYELRVTRAWKRVPGEEWYLGPPKSKAGRRTVEFTAGLWQELLDYGLATMGKDDLLFHDGRGSRLPYSTFYDRWMAGVAEAKKRGVLPQWKFPTFHDLRHSHVAALLSDRHSLTYVQRRLGHESITTTSDTYGHLLETAHTAALVTIDRVMGFTPPASAASQENVPGHDGGRAVYVAHLGSQRIAFWDEGDAEGMAERWVRERGGSVHIEKMTSDGWIGSIGDGASADSALKSVRTQIPCRAWVWEVGPVQYAPDGSEVVTKPSAAETRGSWRWDFEDLYTEELSHRAVERPIGPEPRTVAWAWGRDEDTVRAAFATARAEALRICGLIPSARAGNDQESLT